VQFRIENGLSIDDLPSFDSLVVGSAAEHYGYYGQDPATDSTERYDFFDPNEQDNSIDVQNVLDWQLLEINDCGHIPQFPNRLPNSPHSLLPAHYDLRRDSNVLYDPDSPFLLQSTELFRVTQSAIFSHRKNAFFE
jgi:hypothetical protein